MLEFLSLGSHSSKPCSAKKQKVQVELLQARVALAWGRPLVDGASIDDVVVRAPAVSGVVRGMLGEVQVRFELRHPSPPCM